MNEGFRVVEEKDNTCISLLLLSAKTGIDRYVQTYMEGNTS
jgi:hypothetical protein